MCTFLLPLKNGGVCHRICPFVMNGFRWSFTEGGKWLTVQTLWFWWRSGSEFGSRVSESGVFDEIVGGWSEAWYVVLVRWRHCSQRMFEISDRFSCVHHTMSVTGDTCGLRMIVLWCWLCCGWCAMPAVSGTELNDASTLDSRAALTLILAKLFVHCSRRRRRRPVNYLSIRSSRSACLLTEEGRARCGVKARLCCCCCWCIAGLCYALAALLGIIRPRQQRTAL